MKTKEDIDAETEEQILIDEVLTAEADELEPGNVLAIVHAGVFGMILIGILSVVKYSLLPLLLL
jgi:hypothetical protein